MEPYRYRIFLCTNVREGGCSSCTLRGSADTFACLKQEIIKRGLEFDVKVVKSGCLGLCEMGPNMIVYPEGTWYSGMTPKDVGPFVDSQLIRGQHYDEKAWKDDLLKNFFTQKWEKKKQERGAP